MGITLEEGKMQESVQYLGYIVDAQGLHTSPDKIQAIKEAPQLKIQQQLRAFLGLVNYYGKFLPTLSTTTHPLNQLLQHNFEWAWLKDCQAAFLTLKQQLSSEPVLAHYNSSVPLKLALCGRCSNIAHHAKRRGKANCLRFKNLI